MAPIIKRQRISEQVAEHLSVLVRDSHRPGDRMESERQLAEKLGVSLPTVREALGVLALRGLIERRHGSGTYVLDAAAHRHVAVLMELDIGHARTSFFYTRLVQSLRLQFEAAGHKVRLYVGHTAPGSPFTGLSCREFLEDAQAGRICAVAAIALPPVGQWGTAVVNGIPVVGGEKTFAYGPVIDAGALIREGVARLAGAGRRGMALLGSGGAISQAAFREALEGHGLPYVPDWAPDTGSQPALPGLGWRLFRELWNSRPDKPDGLLVVDDLIFQDAAMAMLEAGIRAPDDLFVVTQANRGSSVHYPFPVVRLEYDPDAFAAVYVDLIGALLKKEPIPDVHPVVPFRVIEPSMPGEGTTGRACVAAV